MFYNLVVLHNSYGFIEVSNHCNAIRHQGIHRIPECGNIPTAGKIQKESVLWGLHYHYYKDSA
jgi:hypothetical protein